MGPWNVVSEGLIGMVIIVNALMIYLLSDKLNDKIQNMYNLEDKHEVTIFVILIEHILILVTLFIKQAIPNIPRKIIKL